MKRRSTLSVVIAMVASLAIATTAFAATLVNGSFESGTNPGSFIQVNAGSTDITGWDVDVAVDYIGTYWTAKDGVRSIDMNASPTMGQISQTFDTAVNNTYVVEFWMSGNPNCGTGAKTMTVQATGTAAMPYTYTFPVGASNSNMGWVDEAYPFKATGSTTTLTFTSTTPGNCGPAIDAVTITETVAPGAACKKDGWRGMTDHEGTPFKNQGDCVSYYATDTRNLAAGQ